MLVEFTQTTDEAINYIAQNMRKDDVREIMLSHGHTPAQALSHVNKGVSLIAMVNGVPAAIFGVEKGSLLTGMGTPWLLGTDDLFKCGKQLMEFGRIGVAAMLQDCSTLSNFVHVDNRRSIVWLKRLGFKFDEPAPYGIAGAMFMRFSMEADNV